MAEVTTELTLPHDDGRKNPPITATGVRGLGQRLVLKRLEGIRRGGLRVRFADGESRFYGDPSATDQAVLDIHDPRCLLRLARSADIGAGEGFMAGEWSSPDVAAVVRLFLANHELLTPSRWLGWAGRIRDLSGHALKANTRRGSRANIRAHYDLSNDFYALFLDRSMTYSAACFSADSTTLAAAQQEKYERLARLAGITPGDHVLEIGCGWGGFAVWAASRLGCRVTGLTLSEAQADIARKLVRRRNLDHLVEIRIEDYRDVVGDFDALVSIEMLEAVGHRYLGAFFATCERSLKPGGRAAVQVITIPDQRYTRYRRASDWIRKYIFPGGHLPSLGAMQQAMARSSRLVVEKADDIAPHYAETLRRWRHRFLAQADRVRSLGFDDTFLRMWEFYLASCEAAFATRHLGTLQMALVRSGDGLVDRSTIIGGAS